jgi:hypothetical protein
MGQYYKRLRTRMLRLQQTATDHELRAVDQHPDLACLLASSSSNPATR